MNMHVLDATLLMNTDCVGKSRMGGKPLSASRQDREQARHDKRKADAEGVSLANSKLQCHFLSSIAHKATACMLVVVCGSIMLGVTGSGLVLSMSPQIVHATGSAVVSVQLQNDLQMVQCALPN